ncbi:unnamed protein product [Protopolystoma xenopodis]|uniref:Protein kinase domain-containing protein n=1 Tax=Protopolystoma xenopodis TaxID=117903 RepID=A0A3S5CS65_9PLAT|nr:unnamed protein product [Protopolystoma xenopodis]
MDPQIYFRASQVLRGENYGRACDVWSVGCCLLEMLTGKPPWNDSYATNSLALLYEVRMMSLHPDHFATYCPNSTVQIHKMCSL